MRHYGLIGEKLGHSLSRPIHEAIFAHVGIDADYRIIEIPRENFVPRVQELLVQGDVTPDGPEREAIYVEIQELIAEEIPYIGIGSGASFHGRQASCGGVLMFEDNCHDYSHAYRIVEG